VLLRLGLRLPLHLSLKSWRGGRDGDVLLHIVLQHQATISMAG
jgi:hypothetical protein